MTYSCYEKNHFGTFFTDTATSAEIIFYLLPPWWNLVHLPFKVIIQANGFTVVDHFVKLTWIDSRDISVLYGVASQRFILQYYENRMIIVRHLLKIMVLPGFLWRNPRQDRSVYEKGLPGFSIGALIFSRDLLSGIAFYG